jgi:hypothetical protein
MQTPLSSTPRKPLRSVELARPGGSAAPARGHQVRKTFAAGMLNRDTIGCAILSLAGLATIILPALLRTAAPQVLR